MSIIGSYVWYNRKNSIVKVLEYDRSNESYTIEYNGSVIDTTDKFIDKNIAESMKFFKTKIELEEKILDLEYLVEKLKDENKELKEDVDSHKTKILELNFKYIEEMSAQEESRIKIEKGISVRDKVNETLKDELEKLKYEHDELIDENKELKDEIEKLIDENERLTDDIEELKEDVKKLENENKKLLNTHKTEIHELNFKYIEELRVIQNRAHDAQEEASIKLEKAINIRDKKIERLKTELIGKQPEKETVVINYSLENKTDKFLWKEPSPNNDNVVIDLYSDFSTFKKYLGTRYFSADHGDARRLMEQQFNNLFLQKNEYIVGVYYTLSFSYTDYSSNYNKMVFYTNYGNVTSFNFRFFMGTCSSDTLNTLRTDKKLTVKMINIINKSINSGFKSSNPPYGQESKKSPEELYDFIKEVSDI